MWQQKIMDEVGAKMADLFAQNPVKDIEKNVKAMLGHALAHLEVVTREEFEVQQALLLRTRTQLDALVRRVDALEAQLALDSAAEDAQPLNKEDIAETPEP